VQGLMDLGLSYQDIETQASHDGMSFLHCAVRSRNAGMVSGCGVVWASCGRCRHGECLNCGVGVTIVMQAW
jgi:histone acetyltransferase (RNA polymerase elongator complex component)